MNFYYLAFKYKGKTDIVKVTAVQLANEMLGKGEDIIEFLIDEENSFNESQYFSERIYVDGNYYMLEFDEDNTNCFCISKCDIEEGIDGNKKYYAGTIVERNIPWICVKIVDECNNELYNIGNSINW